MLVQVARRSGQKKGEADVINFLLVMCEGRINQPGYAYGRRDIMLARTQSDQNYCILPDGRAPLSDYWRLTRKGGL